VRIHGVRCINKPNPESPYEQITHLGDGLNFWWTRDEVVRLIERGGDSFFTLEGTTGAHLEIHVIREPGREPYLQTRPAGPLADALLALPPCARWHPHARDAHGHQPFTEGGAPADRLGPGGAR
jgi:hypothetical protein